MKYLPGLCYRVHHFQKSCIFHSGCKYCTCPVCGKPKSSVGLQRTNICKDQRCRKYLKNTKRVFKVSKKYTKPAANKSHIMGQQASNLCTYHNGNKNPGMRNCTVCRNLCWTNYDKYKEIMICDKFDKIDI